MAIEGDAKRFHLSLFQNAMGEALKAGSYKVVFNNTMANRPSPEADQLSDFSSWV